MFIQLVKSSQIVAMGYEELSQTLRIYFGTEGIVKSVYDYPDSPLNWDDFNAWLASDSVGSYFYRNWKSRLTHFRRLSGEDHDAALAALEAAQPKPEGGA